MDNLDELVINVVTAQNGHKDYYAGRNIASEMQAIEDSLYGVAKGSEQMGKSTEKNTQKVVRLRSEMKKTTTQAQLLSRAFRWIGGFFALSKLKDYADDWTQITSQIRLLTDTEEERVALQQKLYDISQNTRNATKETVDLYTKLTMNAQSLNLSQEKRLQLTELINKALVAGGGSAEDNKRVLLQFGQALGIGRFQGQDLKSILQSNIGFAKTIAQGLGVDVGQLTEMGARGELTSEKVINAILSQQDEINERFSKTSATIKQSLGALSDSFMKFVGETDEAIGLTSKLSTVLNFLAKNIKLVGEVMSVYLIKRLIDMRRVFLESRRPIGTFLNYLQMLISGEVKNGLIWLGKAGWKAVAPFLALAAKLYIFAILIKLLKELWNLFTGKENIFEQAWEVVFDKIEERLGRLPDKFSEILKEMAQMVKEWFAETKLGKFFGYEAPRNIPQTVGRITSVEQMKPLPQTIGRITSVEPIGEGSSMVQNQTVNVTINEAKDGAASYDMLTTALRQANTNYAPYPWRNK